MAAQSAFALQAATWVAHAALAQLLNAQVWQSLTLQSFGWPFMQLPLSQALEQHSEANMQLSPSSLQVPQVCVAG